MKRIVPFKKSYLLILLLFLPFLSFLSKRDQPNLEWPEITEENKPWTRWWWQGSAVNKHDISLLLGEYADAGIGGVEITPIYGVKGHEEEFINFLNEKFMAMLEYTLIKADSLNMGVDMANGTGWPFGGPWVDLENAPKYISYKTYSLGEGESLEEPVRMIQEPLVRAVRNQINIDNLQQPVSSNNSLQALALEQVRFEKSLPLTSLMAYSDKGSVIDLSDKITENGELVWTAPEGNWVLYAVFMGDHGKLVERAAPGGEGNVIDHFSREALRNYLDFFDTAMAGYDLSHLRAWFNDSYEVDDAYGEADFTPDFFREFRERRGYDLREELPALFGQDTTDEIDNRVLCDYRTTISELILDEFTKPWREWARSQNKLIRNQSHGSPANLLDLYAASDIPETEGTDLFRIKFASSAANISGKKLISCEASTWLDEHFKGSLAEVRQNLERYFLGGVNHIVYHGTCYSPPGIPWPGWMFYASVHFAPSNTFWKDFHALNQYVSRCQSFLQEGRPDNDLLLYFPFFDLISGSGDALLKHFTTGHAEEYESDFREIAEKMTGRGYLTDYISDLQVQSFSFTGEGISTGYAEYKTIVLPACRYISLETFRKLMSLAGEGATVLVHNELPETVEGFEDLKNRQSQYDQLVEKLNFQASENGRIRVAKYGMGKFIVGEDIEKMLEETGINPEPLRKEGLQFIRRKFEDGKVYFILNSSGNEKEGWFPLQSEFSSAALFNPLTEQYGLAATRTSEEGRKEVFIQMQAGEACILRTFPGKRSYRSYPYRRRNGNLVEIRGKWTVEFLEGGPEIPSPENIDEALPWTDLQKDELKNFSGTANYKINFNRPMGNADAWLLKMEKVDESATIFINGSKLGTVFSKPYSLEIPNDLLTEENTLEIRVSNLMANRIAWMDRNGIEYKKFYNINFPPKKEENRDANGLFTAAQWSPEESGLTGPVILIPVIFEKPAQ